MKNTELIFLNSYCNTEKKLKLLNNTIDNIRQYFPELKIAVHAQYPLDVETQNKTDFYFFLNNNPILKDKTVVFWTHIFGIKKLNYVVLDYGYAALQQLKSILEISKIKGFETIIYSDYDLNVVDNHELLKKLIHSENKNIFFKYRSSFKIEDHDGINMTMIKFDVDLGYKLSHLISLNNYINSNKLPEQMLKDFYNYYEFEYELIDHIPKTENYTNEDLNPNNFNVSDDFLTSYFKSILFTYDETLKENVIMFWDLSENKISNITLKIDGEEINYNTHDIINYDDKINTIKVNTNPKEIVITKINEIELTFEVDLQFKNIKVNNY